MQDIKNYSAAILELAPQINHLTYDADALNQAVADASVLINTHLEEKSRITTQRRHVVKAVDNLGELAEEFEAAQQTPHLASEARGAQLSSTFETTVAILGDMVKQDFKRQIDACIGKSEDNEALKLWNAVYLDGERYKPQNIMGRANHPG